MKLKDKKGGTVDVTLSNKEIEAKIREVLNKDLFVLKSVNQVNHNPHPYTIGPKHVSYAADHHGGMLDERTLDKVPCAFPGGCNLDHASHTSDTVAFLSLKRDIEKKEAQDELKKLIDHVGKETIAGVVFVETKQKYRFI